MDKARASKQRRQGSALSLGWPQGQITLDLFGSTSLWFLSHWTFELLPPFAKPPCKVCLLDTAVWKFYKLGKTSNRFCSNPNVMAPNVPLCLAQDGSHSPVLNFHSATYTQTWWKSFDTSSKLSGVSHPKLFICCYNCFCRSSGSLIGGHGNINFKSFACKQNQTNKVDGWCWTNKAKSSWAFRLHCFHCQKPYRKFEPSIVAMLNHYYEPELISSHNTLLGPTHLGTVGFFSVLQKTCMLQPRTHVGHTHLKY